MAGFQWNTTRCPSGKLKVVCVPACFYRVFLELEAEPPAPPAAELFPLLVTADGLPGADVSETVDIKALGGESYASALACATAKYMIGLMLKNTVPAI